MYRSRTGQVGADFRYLGRGRFVLRNPDAPGWHPDRKVGEPTTSEQVAKEWVTDYLRAWRRQTQDQQLGIQESRPLRDLAQEWLDDRQVHVEPGTWKGDQTAMRHLRSWVGDDRAPETVTTKELQQAINKLLRAGMAAGTARNIRDKVAKLYDWMELGVNPARALRLPKEGIQEKEGWDDEQIKAARKAADELDASGEYRISARLALELGLATGAREGELFAIEWQRFNARRWTVRIVQQAARKDAGGLKQLKGKAPRTALVLPSWWEWHRPGARGFVLGLPDGSLVQRKKERRIIAAVMEAAGLKRDREANHMLRHTYSRLFLHGGGKLQQLQRSLGHTSIRTTELYYGHYSEDVAAEQAAVAIYRDYLRRGVGTDHV